MTHVKCSNRSIRRLACRWQGQSGTEHAVGQEVYLTGAVALTFTTVHAAGKAMRFLDRAPRSIWLSLAGGVSLAYVFVHLLPELASWQQASAEHVGAALESHIYLAALVGLATFYGLHRLIRSERSHRRYAHRQPASSPPVFWIHLSSYALYSMLIGYLLVQREESDLRGLAIYALALGLHFVINDQALRQDHGKAYDRVGAGSSAPPRPQAGRSHSCLNFHRLRSRWSSASWQAASS